MPDSRAEKAFLHIIANSRLLEVLHDDNKAIVRAASAASKAADFILGFAPDAARTETADAEEDEQIAA